MTAIAVILYSKALWYVKHEIKKFRRAEMQVNNIRPNTSYFSKHPLRLGS
jgi:hypothetical protein